MEFLLLILPGRIDWTGKRKTECLVANSISFAFFLTIQLSAFIGEGLRDAFDAKGKGYVQMKKPNPTPKTKKVKAKNKFQKEILSLEKKSFCNYSG